MDVWALRGLRWAYVAFIAAASGLAIAQAPRTAPAGAAILATTSSCWRFPS